MLPSGFAVVGVARREKSHEKFRSEMREGVSSFSRRKPVDEAVWDDFERGIHYVQGEFDRAETYAALKAQLAALDSERGTRNRLYYLAVPPSEFGAIVSHLREADLIEEPGGDRPITRVVVEKPFGHDLASARELNTVFASAFD
jgi:glucose-6-phosphate 1-dehydrogenase